jgi:hypothetical protein
MCRVGAWYMELLYKGEKIMDVKLDLKTLRRSRKEKKKAQKINTS